MKNHTETSPSSTQGKGKPNRRPRPLQHGRKAGSARSRPAVDGRAECGGARTAAVNPHESSNQPTVQALYRKKRNIWGNTRKPQSPAAAPISASVLALTRTALRGDGAWVGCPQQRRDGFEVRGDGMVGHQALALAERRICPRRAWLWGCRFASRGYSNSPWEDVDLQLGIIEFTMDLIHLAAADCANKRSSRGRHSHVLVRGGVEEIHEGEEWDAGEIGELEVAAVETVWCREEQRLGVRDGDPEWFHLRRRGRINLVDPCLSHFSESSLCLTGKASSIVLLSGRVLTTWPRFLYHWLESSSAWCVLLDHASTPCNTYSGESLWSWLLS